MTDEEWTVGNSASVHPSTLGALSRGEVGQPEKKKRAERQPAPQIHYTQVHPVLWSKVIELAQGDRSRIEIENELCCTVHNNDKWRSER